MGKHTTGTWEVFTSVVTDTWPGIAVIGVQDIVVFGDAQDNKDDGGVRGATMEEALANARLMAAAPAMLATLRTCAAAFRDYEMQHMNKDPPSFAKAATNRELAEACERVIERATEGG